VAGVYLIATKTTWFQTIWQYATSSIGAAWRWLWNSVLEPVIKFILNGFATVELSIGHVLQALGHIHGFGWAKVAGDLLVSAGQGAQKLADNLHKIPASVPVDVRFTSNYSVVQAQLLNLLTQKNKLMAGHAASGTDNWAGGSLTVGENGPERVFLPSGSQVKTAAATARMGAGAGASAAPTPLIVQLVLDGNVVHQSLLKVKRTIGGGLGLEATP
jgi:phage-related protein